MKLFVKARWVVALAAALAGLLPQGAARAEKPSCAERKGVLGVSRVVEIDTSGGLRFGNMQYKDIDFLKPGEVVLTFDDGPLRPKTTSVLNALEAHCTKATFFMVGRMALVDPSMVREIDRRGHTVATHSWSHKMQGRLSKTGGVQEYELGLSAISLALGKPAAPFFRFPYLSDPTQMQGYLKSRDTGIFSIDVDSLDFRTRSGQAMIDRTMNGLKRLGKGILLFHDIQRSTASGVADLLDELKRQGFKVVHVIAKKPATTLPEFDEMAKKEAARREKIAKSRPLAARSIVWPVATANEFPKAEPLKFAPPGLFKGPLPERSGRPPSEKLRQSLTTDGDAPQPPEKRPSDTEADSASLQGAPKRDWRNDVFNN